jgi:hypothetical protein
MQDGIRGEQGQVAIELPLWMVASVPLSIATVTAGRAGVSAKFIGPANASVLSKANATPSATVLGFTACSNYRFIG